MSLRVDTHYSGSRCVIWRNKEHYIDVIKNVGPNQNQDRAECVRRGQVYKRLWLHTDPAIASVELIQLMRQELMG